MLKNKSLYFSLNKQTYMGLNRRLAPSWKLWPLKAYMCMNQPWLWQLVDQISDMCGMTTWPNSMTFRKLVKFREIPVCWQSHKHCHEPQDFISVLTHVRCVNHNPVSKISLVLNRYKSRIIRGENKIASHAGFFLIKQRISYAFGA